jgi:hypothetical protein
MACSGCGYLLAAARVAGEAQEVALRHTSPFKVVLFLFSISNNFGGRNMG